VAAVHEAAAEAIEHARSGQGPVFLAVNTCRMSGHYVGDPQVYRPKDEAKDLRESEDPIEKLRERLGVSDEEWEELDREATQIADEAVEFGQNGTDPAPEAALENVYA
jgi:TPP-dependent pyruvate/acetoin dehydrogenase alpha subunit